MTKFLFLLSGVLLFTALLSLAMTVVHFFSYIKNPDDYGDWFLCFPLLMTVSITLLARTVLIHASRRFYNEHQSNEVIE